VSSSEARVGVGAVAVRDETLLMVRRGRGAAQGEWSVPGGHVEHGEPLHLAVVREVFEETGLEVVVDRFLGWVERIPLDPTDPAPTSDDHVSVDHAGHGHEAEHIVILDFAVTPLDADQALVAGDDAAEARWVPFGDVSDLRLVDGLYEFLRDHRIL
jgi:8-oxo-dGTP diphosphatase